jgi:hypothetical protein
MLFADRYVTRFSEIEAVAVTVALLRNYSIHLDPKKAEEYERLNLSVHERTERLTKSVNVITLTYVHAPPSSTANSRGCSSGRWTFRWFLRRESKDLFPADGIV